MNRKWTTAFWMMALVVMVVAVGCGPKEPPQMPAEVPMVEPDPEPVEVAPPPAPPTVEDPKPHPLDDDLVIANKYAIENGLLGDVYFDFDKYDLRADSRQRLEKNAEFMKKYGNFVFGLEGHCDERGTNEYNMALGEQRALAARRYLVELGVGAARLGTVSYGEEQPLDPRSTEDAWAKNRRAHFVVSE